MEAWNGAMAKYIESILSIGAGFSTDSFYFVSPPTTGEEAAALWTAYGNPRQDRPQDGREGTTSEWHPEAHTFRRQGSRGSAVQVQHVSGITSPPHFERDRLVGAKTRARFFHGNVQPM